MKLDTFLNYLIIHNATIIEVLIGLVLLAVLILSVRTFMYGKEESVSAPASVPELEASLKKILEKANQVPSVAAAAAVGAGADTTALLAEISKLKSELESKQKKIEELSGAAGATAVEGAPTGGGISIDEREKLEAQIKELQGKLSEYEIISEDIADLSFYKEQNARLQKELDAVKGGAPASSAPTEAPPVVDPIEASVSALAESTAAAPASPTPPPAAPATSTAAPAAAPAEAPAPPVENVVDNDLMAEFAAAVEKQKGGAPAGEASADLGAMNMDKMLAEAAEIKTDVPDIKPEDVLNQSMDENKLLAEANAMKAEEGKSSEDKKLMGQFENFVKKGDS